MTTRGNHGRTRTRVVVVGGGVAALEAVLALRPLVGERVEIELVAPQAELVYAPMTVTEPFDLGEAQRFDLPAIARDLGVRLRRDTIAAVDAERRSVLTTGGESISYRALVVATGARRTPWLPGAITFGGGADNDALREALGASRLVFAAPPSASWPLPLYELALLASVSFRHRGRITIVTPEEAPLGVFGAPASEAVAALLDEREIDCWCESHAAFFAPPRLQVVPDGMLFVDAVVALAELEGRPPLGLPHDRRGFIPTDEYGRVPGLDAVYAAGDGTTQPVKQGGVATQQADAVALHLASALGAPVEPRPFEPVLRAILVTGDEPLYLRGGAPVANDAPWQPAAKIAGRYLAPYLADLERSGHVA